MHLSLIRATGMNRAGCGVNGARVSDSLGAMDVDSARVIDGLGAMDL